MSDTRRTTRSIGGRARHSSSQVEVNEKSRVEYVCRADINEIEIVEVEISDVEIGGTELDRAKIIEVAIIEFRYVEGVMSNS